MKTFSIFVAIILASNAIVNPYQFLSSSEVLLMEYAVHRDSLFIVKEDFDKFQERNSTSTEPNEGDIASVVERDGLKAFLVDRETMHIIKNQSFNPLDLAE